MTGSKKFVQNITNKTKYNNKTTNLRQSLQKVCVYSSHKPLTDPDFSQEMLLQFVWKLSSGTYFMFANLNRLSYMDKLLIWWKSQIALNLAELLSLTTRSE